MVNWQTKKLGEVVLIYNGNSINEEVKKNNYLGLVKGIPYIATKDIGYDGIVNYNNGVKIPKGEFRFKKAGPGVVFVCAEGGSAGRKVAYIDRTVCFVNKLFAIKPSKYLDEKFLYFWFLSDSFKDQFFSNKTGLIGGVSMKKFKELVMSFPDVQEQKRIVGILDKVFENIDKAKENTEKNLQNSKELFETYLDNIFRKPDMKWSMRKWGDVCDFVRGPFGGSLKKSIFKNEGFAVYEQKQAIHDHFTNLRYFIDEAKFIEMRRFELKPGDLIMSCSGVTLGRVALAPVGIKRGIINQALLKLTPTKVTDAHYLRYWIKSKVFQDIIKNYSQGAAIPNVPSTKILKNVLIPLPLVSKQKEIVKKIDGLSEQTKKLEENYKQKLLLLDELKKSVLTKTFAGEL